MPSAITYTIMESAYTLYKTELEQTKAADEKNDHQKAERSDDDAPGQTSESDFIGGSV